VVLKCEVGKGAGGGGVNILSGRDFDKKSLAPRLINEQPNVSNATIDHVIISRPLFSRDIALAPPRDIKVQRGPKQPGTIHPVHPSIQQHAAGIPLTDSLTCP
jgi:hypothetical protein